jgi:uncharacterized membrane protein
MKPDELTKLLLESVKDTENKTPPELKSEKLTVLLEDYVNTIGLRARRSFLFICGIFMLWINFTPISTLALNKVDFKNWSVLFLLFIVFIGFPLAYFLGNKRFLALPSAKRIKQTAELQVITTISWIGFAVLITIQGAVKLGLLSKFHMPLGYFLIISLFTIPALALGIHWLSKKLTRRFDPDYY